MSRVIGTSAYGLRAPIFKEGDDLIQPVINAIKDSGLEPRDNDIIAITESVVARTQGNYVTVDEVAESVRQVTNNAKTIVVAYPIYSRNRFAMILKGIARGVGEKIILVMPDIDEKGNVLENHPVTKMSYNDYYKTIVENESKQVEFHKSMDQELFEQRMDLTVLVSSIHTRNKDKAEIANLYPSIYDLTDICSDKCEYGLLGSNKSSEEKLKLFPNGEKAKKFVSELQTALQNTFNKHFEVAIYGDGCYHDETTGIWEFADPVTCPAYTDGLSGSANEIKIKNFADDKYETLSGQELTDAIKNEITNKGNLDGRMESQGTTPRKFYSLVASLSDLMSGSGDKATPFVYIQGYFDNMSSD